MRLLHAIHDFLPRHRAGSEIYALALGRELARRHHVTILCADYDPARAHGHVTWRVQDGLPVVEIVNNWVCGSFEDTYRPPVIGDRLRHVLRAVQPDVVHVHNLLNLSFDLPALARAARHSGRGDAARLHARLRVGRAADSPRRGHVCHEIDVDRCARCFGESPFSARMSLGAGRGGARRPCGAWPGLARGGCRALTSRLADGRAAAGRHRRELTSRDGSRPRAMPGSRSICSSRRRRRWRRSSRGSASRRRGFASPTTGSRSVRPAGAAPAAGGRSGSATSARSSGTKACTC